MDSKKKWRGHSLGSLKKWICGLHFMKLFTKQSIRVMFFANIVTEPLHIHLLSANWRTAVQQSQWLDIYAINCRSNTLIVWYQIRSWLCRLGNIQLKLFFCWNTRNVCYTYRLGEPSERATSERAKEVSQWAEPSLCSGSLVARLAMTKFPWAERGEVRYGSAQPTQLFANPGLTQIDIETKHFINS